MPRSKEEAIAAGVKIAETQHHMKRRKLWHDYHSKGTYMLTNGIIIHKEDVPKQAYLLFFI